MLGQGFLTEKESLQLFLKGHLGLYYLTVAVQQIVQKDLEDFFDKCFLVSEVVVNRYRRNTRLPGYFRYANPAEAVLLK
nr:hypothetical protein [Dehalococcoides mccartyi]